MLIKPIQRLEGTVTIPGDKSVSHRAAIFSAIADGESTITNFLVSQDCLSTLECLRGMGVTIERSGETVSIAGRGLHGLLAPSAPLDCGNSGTTARTLSGVLAAQRFESMLVGDGSLSRRPMRRIITPLTEMGAAVDSADGCLPLRFRPAERLTGISYHAQVASAQVKTCILLAGLYAEGATSVTEPIVTRDHTERMFEWLGADISSADTPEGRKVMIRGGKAMTARDINVPGDISSAAFLLVAAGCLAGSHTILKNVGLNPTRRSLLDFLIECGIDLRITDEASRSNEPAGDIEVVGGLRPRGETVKIDKHRIAGVIDELPILAILGSRLRGGLEVRDAAELRVKESDRIAAVVSNLRAIGGKIDEFEDGFRVYPSRLTGGNATTFGDHRIAMAFAVAGLLSDNGVEIDDPACAEVSFPNFFGVLERAAS